LPATDAKLVVPLKEVAESLAETAIEEVSA